MNDEFALGLGIAWHGTGGVKDLCSVCRGVGIYTAGQEVSLREQKVSKIQRGIFLDPYSQQYRKEDSSW
jgi:hypothetical protein